MKTIRIPREVLRGIHAELLDQHYANYRKVFHSPPFKSDGANFVPGIGDRVPIVVFVGEAPGEEEDKTQKPFQGRAGHLLFQMLNDSGISNRTLVTDRVFITNVVKYRPPKNNLTHEVAVPAYPMLRTEIDILNPRVIVPLGKWSAATWFQNFSITQIAGKVYQKDGRTVFPMLHPSYVLRNRSAEVSFRNGFKDLAWVLRQRS